MELYILVWLIVLINFATHATKLMTKMIYLASNRRVFMAEAEYFNLSSVSLYLSPTKKTFNALAINVFILM